MPRHPIGTNPLQQGICVCPSNLVLAKTRQIGKANGLTHRATLFTDDLKTVVAPETILLTNPLPRIPLGPFPAKGVTVHGTGVFEGVV